MKLQAFTPLLPLRCAPKTYEQLSPRAVMKVAVVAGKGPVVAARSRVTCTQLARLISTSLFPPDSDSINGRIGVGPNQGAISRSLTLLRYLLGGVYNVGGRQFNRRGNLSNSEAVIWTIEQKGVPVYAMRPINAFAAVYYKLLVVWFIEQQIAVYPDYKAILQEQNINFEVLDEYWDYFSDYETPIQDDPKSQAASGSVTRKGDRKKAPPVAPATPPIRTSAIVVPGTVIGKVELRSGQVGEVINPTMRGMQNWVANAMIGAFGIALAPSGADTVPVPSATQLNLFLSHLMSRMLEETRNFGKTGMERARNFVATDILTRFVKVLEGDNLLIFYKFVNNWDNLQNIWLDRVTVVPSPSCRPKSECYDVRIYFFDANSDLLAELVVSISVDINNSVPAFISEIKVDVMPQQRP